jgi:branched-chain amino acid transport system ATP-binding protein
MSELVVTEVTAGYKGTDVLRDISLTVAPGEKVAVLGSNGAGKSTLLRVLSGQLRPRTGQRLIDDIDTTRWSVHKVARAGVRWIGEPRPIYPGLTVTENLEVGGLTRRDSVSRQAERVYELMPALHAKRADRAGSLSGGQQQMLALGQALMSEPRYLCLDEPSTGLAPSVVAMVAKLVTELAGAGVGIVWAEQFPQIALARCDRALVLRGGSAVESGPASQITPERLETAYLGERNA